MLFPIIITVSLAAMWIAGMSAISIAIACAMAVAGVALFRWSDDLVERITGRSSANPTETSKAINLSLTLLIGLPPIFLLPDAHPFVHVAFQIIGMAIGGVVAQSLFGKLRRTEGISSQP